MKNHSINYSIPIEKIVKDVPYKKKWYATVIPGDLSTYIFKEESEYYNDYKESVFGYTKKKSGWDCMRHYEILANGCIPIFENINDIPDGTMQTFPKDALKDFYKKMDSIIEAGNMNCEEIKNFIRFLIEYTRENLTTIYTVKQMMKTLSISDTDIPKILFISGDKKKCKQLNKALETRICYLKSTVFHGLKILYGRNVDEFPSMNYMYDDFPVDIPLYGNGFSYSRLLQAKDKKIVTENEMLTNLDNGYYDMIIYGSLKHGLYGLKNYESIRYFPKLIVLNGYDKKSQNRINKYMKKNKLAKLKNITMFTRELK